MDKALNRQQKEAIAHDKGPLLIIAGAGTGKTTVITERIKHLIVDKNVPPASILALTFTQKAAFEMQERIDMLLPYGYTNLWIDTFHSFCDKILRDEAHQIGLDPNYKLLGESESVLLLRSHIFELGLKLFRPLGNPTKFISAILSHFSRLKDEDISPSDYIAWVQSQKSNVPPKARLAKGGKSQMSPEELAQYLELANSYRDYEKLKVKESAMDFSDLISNTLLLFRTRKSVLKRYQKQFQFLLVDEFQDTNYAQNELAILLAGDDHNITVVADDDQSIYRFRGAAVSNVLQFKKNFSKTKIITLTDNYRSTQTILDASYNLIQHNNPNRLEVVEKIDKKLKSHSVAQKKDIEIIHEARSEDEADAIARKITDLSKKYDYSDMAILVRANNHAQLITTALSRHKIPYQFLGPGYLFQQEEIKDLISYLVFLTNLSDSVSLFRVLSMDIFDIPYVDINYLLNFAKKKNISLFEALNFTEEINITIEAKKKLFEFREMVDRHTKRIKKDTAGQILYYFLVDSNLFKTLLTTTSVKDEKRAQNIAKFFDRIKNFETERNDSNIFTLVEWIMLMLQMGDSPTAAEVDMRDKNAVNILTVHSSKGLEFKVVFLVNLVSDRFPSRERKEKIPIPQEILKENIASDIDFNQQEERRLFYVGMTRAKERLFFTTADFYSAGKRIKKLSPFIYEALPEFSKQEKLKEKAQQLSFSQVLSVYENIEEKPEEKQPLKITYITFSNLQMFDICPLHYRAKAILGIPTPVAAVQSFGISIHSALYNFYKQLQEGGAVSLAQMLSILKKEWKKEGYEGKQEKEYFAEAVKMLTNFYKTELKTPQNVLGLELPFSFVLKNKVKVFGKIDRIDKKGKGIEIIDYKTGEDNPKAEKSHQLQLEMYALAATRVKDAILNRDPKDIILTLHFLKGNTKKSMNFKQEDLDRLENDLIEKIAEIEKSDFKCSKSVLCINCEYKILCSVN